MHGNVWSRKAVPHAAYSRYVAVLDVLGMKEWLKNESANGIAESLDEALVACDQSSCGVTSDGSSYGPLIQVTHFSDTLLAWSPDDSWASLSAMCSAIKLIVGISLTHGVPLRGSIAHGDVVCNRRTLRFVGQAIAEAFVWSENDRPYRSVGVDLTPQTIAKLNSWLIERPIPKHWESEIEADVIKRTNASRGNLMWHAECLFVNHWAHGMFVRADPEVMFYKRGLNVPMENRHDVYDKIIQMKDFYGHYQRLPYSSNFRHDDFNAQQLDYVQLERLSKERD